MNREKMPKIEKSGYLLGVLVTVIAGIVVVGCVILYITEQQLKQHVRPHRVIIHHTVHDSGRYLEGKISFMEEDQTGRQREITQDVFRDEKKHEQILHIPGKKMEVFVLQKFSEGKQMAVVFKTNVTSPAGSVVLCTEAPLEGHFVSGTHLQNSSEAISDSDLKLKEAFHPTRHFMEFQYRTCAEIPKHMMTNDVTDIEEPKEPESAQRMRREQPYGAWCGPGQGGIGLPCCPGCNADSQSCLSPTCAPAVDQVDFACYTFKMCEECTSHRTSGLPACACIKDFSMDLEKSRCQGMATSPTGMLQLFQSLLGAYMPLDPMGSFQGALASGGYQQLGGIQAGPAVIGNSPGAGAFQSAGMGINGIDSSLYNSQVSMIPGRGSPLNARQQAPTILDVSASMPSDLTGAYNRYLMEPMGNAASVVIDQASAALVSPQNVVVVDPQASISPAAGPAAVPSAQASAGIGPTKSVPAPPIEVIAPVANVAPSVVVVPTAADTVPKMSNVAAPAPTLISGPFKAPIGTILETVHQNTANAASAYSKSMVAAAQAEVQADVQASLADVYREHASTVFDGLGRRKRQINQILSNSMYDRKGCFQYRSRTMTELMHQRCWCPVFIRVKYVCGYQQVAGSCKMTSNGEKCSVKYQVCNKLMSKNTLNAVNYSKCPSLP